ncbi:Uncharacterised protein [Halioglobus japonicus]|nr:Uncharacterised protein [Halioglobus japonicus]
MKIHFLIALVWSCSMLFGCASVEQASAEREKLASEPLPEAVASLGYEIGAPVEQVTEWSLYNWQSINETSLIIWVDAFHPYLFTLRELCPSLAFAQTIGVSNSGPTIDANFDAIVVPNPPGGGEQCFIDKIYPLTKIKKADS